MYISKIKIHNSWKTSLESRLFDNYTAQLDTNYQEDQYYCLIHFSSAVDELKKNDIYLPYFSLV